MLKSQEREENSHAGTAQSRRRLSRLALAAGLLLCAAVPAVAQSNLTTAGPYTEGFDTPDGTTFQVTLDGGRLNLARHERHSIRHSGRFSERFLIEAYDGGRARLEHALPAARAIPDLKLTLWMHCNRGEADLFMRVVFPHQEDPRTGQALTTYIQGDRYSREGRWQQLHCAADPRQIRDRVMQLRARLQQPMIDDTDPYVDQVVLTVPVERGVTEILVDALEFGPIVPPAQRPQFPTADSEETQPDFDVEFLLDRLMVDQQAFFPRFAAYHGERIDVLKEVGLNVVWVPDYRDRNLLSGLKRRGLWAAATPPRPAKPAGSDHRTGLVPLGEETSRVLAWMFGTGIPPDAENDFVEMLQQVRNADRKFHRPVMADVDGLEHVYSRHDLMMGISRNFLHTSFSFKQYRQWLQQKRELAQPGAFLWSWVETEPAAEHYDLRLQQGQHPAVIEPEQIRLQVYAALAEGFRGLGYWKQLPLDADVPGAEERRLAISQLNLELELLKSWLASGTVIARIPFSVPQSSRSKIGQRLIDFRHSEEELEEREAILRERDNQKRRASQIRGELQASLIKTDYGKLLLPVWYETDAQFVPGPMTARNVSIVVPGIAESASAWLVTPTGIISLEDKRVTGGTRIEIPVFDQTAAIIFTSSTEVVASLRRATSAMALTSARVSIDLATAKLQRVRHVVEELREVHAGQPDGPQLLAGAESRRARAEDAFKRGDYASAAEEARSAMRLLRILQRAHWFEAVLSLYSPVSSPHTICFQTLPDHWRMIAELGRSPAHVDNNLLVSGDFEDSQAIVSENWGHAQNNVPGIRAAAELYHNAKEGDYALRLIAVPQPGREEPITVVPDNPVRVTTPAVNVHAGQIVHVSGWVRVVSPIVGNVDGAMLFDNLAGRSGALRWRYPAGWQRFQLIREVRRSGPFHLTVELNGMGEILLDDLAIVPHTPRPEAIAEQTPEETDSRSAASRALEFLNRLPKIPRPSFR